MQYYLRAFVSVVAGIALVAIPALLPADDKGTADQQKGPGPVDFQRDLLPVFQAKCIRCHGTMVKKADLNLELLDGVIQGGESGAVVVAGKPDESSLYERVHAGEMPPDGQEGLTESEIDLVRRWILAGAGAGQDTAAESTDNSSIDQHSVLPILLRRCTACHGRNRQEGQLDLRTPESLLRGGKSGPVVVSGQPEASLLIQRVRTGEMPPGERLVEASVKPIEPKEIETLARWIEAGLPIVADRPDIATGGPDPLLSDEDRDFWAFRPPQPVQVPSFDPSTGVRNPIDAFILRKLEQLGLGFSPPADRVTLLRRVYFDLTGLPPQPDDVARFLADEDPRAYEALVDRLLDSPHYGEQWGRHWLDVAGYADSEGKREQDLFRPHAWRYRDYVIQAFNADKPFDRFLIEQLAGDELADYENAPEITAEIYDNLVATGFLRMAPDATWANITGYAPDRIEVIADEIDVLGSAVLGLTIKCARCHSHKFDPIPQRDYYRLAAVFKGAYDEYDWVKPDVRAGLGPVSQDVIGGRLLPFVTTAERQAWEVHEARISADIQAAKDRSEPAAVISQLEAQRQPQPQIQALWDRGEPTPTYIYRRGDPLNPGKLVGPGVPAIVDLSGTPLPVQPPWPGARQTGRRLAFARWLTQPDHPLTARVRVNQIWQQHFGQGIVRTLGNFGKTGTPPTHPELLDWLAGQFAGNGWSTKAIHRLIVTSTTYRQSSIVTDEHLRCDPDNSACSRMPMVRLSAEQLYDTLLTVSGQLDERRFGPADAVDKRNDGLITPRRTDRGWRRLIYIQQLRKQVATPLENFDYPQMNPNCLERRDSMVASQALHLMNNGMVTELSDHFARRVASHAGDDRCRQVEYIYLCAFGRTPREDELKIGLAALDRLHADWIASSGSAGDPDTNRLKALATYCHAIMNSANFLYVD